MFVHSAELKGVLTIISFSKWKDVKGFLRNYSNFENTSLLDTLAGIVSQFCQSDGVWNPDLMLLQECQHK